MSTGGDAHWKHTDIIALLNAAESELPVDQWCLRGVRVWPLVRLVIATQLFYQSRESSPSGGRSKTVEKLLLAAKVMKCYLGDWHHNVHRASAADAVFLTYDVHRQRLGSVWYDRFCDRFVEELDSLGWRSLVYELTATPDLRDCRIPRAHSTVFVQPLVEAAIIIARAAELCHRRSPPPWFDSLTKWCQRRRMLHVVPSFLQLSTASRAVTLLANWFERRFVALGVRVVFTVQYYQLLGYAANVACRRLSIPSVDIQHGLQGEHHAAWGSWQRVPTDGYEVLPSVFWCWSEMEATAIDKWATKTGPHRPFVGGDLWLNTWREVVQARAPIPADTLAAFKPIGTKLVLFTSSYPNDLTDWILTAMRRSPPNVRWAVRLHPSYLTSIDSVRERLDAEGLSSVNVRLATELPLPLVLQCADVNVTSLSSVVVEAAHCRVPSVITDPSGLDTFADLVQSGWATGAFTAEDLSAAVAQRCENPRSAASVEHERVTSTLSQFLVHVAEQTTPGITRS
jgi:hypothetical protein